MKVWQSLAYWSGVLIAIAPQLYAVVLWVNSTAERWQGAVALPGALVLGIELGTALVWWAGRAVR